MTAYWIAKDDEHVKKGINEGERCNRNGCIGVIEIELGDFGNGCCCGAVPAPCPACENTKCVCYRCGWSDDEEEKPNEGAIEAMQRRDEAPDDRRVRCDLRTDAQIRRERAMQRLRQHKLARWGKAKPLKWEDSHG